MVEIPDELLRRIQAEATERGVSLETFIREARAAWLRPSESEPAPSELGWRTAFGRAAADQVAEIDALVEHGLGAIDLDDWR